MYTGQETVVRTLHGDSESFGIHKGVLQGCILSPPLFNLFTESILRRADFENFYGVRIGGRKVTNLRYADDTALMSEEEEDLRPMVKRVKEESKKAGLQLNVKKTKIMTNQGLVEFQIEPGVKLETVNSFDFLGSRIDTTWSSCSEIRRRLGMGRNAMASLRKL